jgi:hypothetical protein
MDNIIWNDQESEPNKKTKTSKKKCGFYTPADRFLKGKRKKDKPICTMWPGT